MLVPKLIPCCVCGDRSSGKHYGAMCCDGCSCFFKRSIRKRAIYSCIAGKGKCIIDKARRNWCSYCRLQRCFQARMNVAAVQEERGPRQTKTSLRLNTVEMANFEYNPKKAVHATLPSSNSSLNFNLLTQILITCIKQAKSNESFLQFSMPQRQLILKNVWTECFVLRASHWPIDISTIIIEQCNDLRLNEFLNETKTLQIDLLEMSLLETLILCRKEYALSGQQLQQINRFSNNALLTLGHYAMQRLDWSRFGRLLLNLRSLSSLKSFEISIDQLFNHIINQIIESE